MIKRSEDIKARAVEKGKGQIYFYDWMTPEEACGHGRLFSKLVIPPGCSIGLHQHNGEFEGFYVLEGQAAVTDGGQEITLNPGDMHLCHDGETHGVENCSDVDLVMIALILNSSNV